MKKYIILFILLFGAGIAISDIDTFEGTATDSLSDIEGSTVAAGEGESYSFYFDFEDETTSIVANEPSDLSGSNNGAAREGSGPSPQAGSYSYYFTVGDRIEFSTSGDAVIDDSVGYCDLYVYLDNMTNPHFIYFANQTQFIQIRINTDGTIRFRYNDGSNNDVETTGTVPVTTWTNLKVGWDAVNDKLGVKIGGGSWETNDPSFDAMGDITTLYFGDPGGGGGSYNIDEAYIYKSAPTDW
jgi:hypothetical protein